MSAAPANLHLRVLEPGAAWFYAGIVHPALHPWLEGLADPLRVAVGGALVQRPVPVPKGIAAVQLPEDGRVGRLVWLYVRSDARRRGIGAAILAELEAEVAGRACTRLRHTYAYPVQEPDRALADFLRDNGWVLEEPAFLVCEGTPAILDAPWMAQELREPFELVPWEALHAAERRELEGREVETADRRRIHGLPSPISHPEDVEPRASLWMRWRGRLVGWLVSRKIDEETYQIDSLYTAPEVRGSAPVAALLHRAIRTSVEAGYRRAIFEVRADNAAMARFVRRRLVPYGVVVTEFCRAEKEVASTPLTKP